MGCVAVLLEDEHDKAYLEKWLCQPYGMDNVGLPLTKNAIVSYEVEYIGHIGSV